MSRSGWIVIRAWSAPATLMIGWLCSATVRGADGASESWDAVYIRGSRVGYFHTQVFPVADRGRNLLRVQVDMSLSFKRNGDPISIETLYGTIETPDGTVLRLDSRTVASRHFRARSGGPVSTARRLTPCVLHAPAGG